MKIFTHRIPYKYGDVIKIRPISDIHYGSKYCDLKALKKDLASMDDKTYFYLGGDNMDSIVTVDPRYSKHVDNTVGDAILDEQVDGLFNLLEPYKDKCIGVMRGNHEDQVIKRYGTDPANRLAKLLNCEYMGYSGLLRLLFRQKDGGGRKIILRYHHGWGGGSRTQGADLTKYSKDTIHWDADVFFYGHVHRKQADRIPRMGLVGEKLMAKPKMIGICGTYLKTYSSGVDTTYSELKGYPPVEIGGIVINIKPSKEWVNMWTDV